MIAALFVEIALVIAKMPVGYVSASVATGFLGFNLLPTSGAVEWFLPWETRYSGSTRSLSLLGMGVMLLAVVYWGYAIVSSPSHTFGLDFLAPGLYLLGASLVVYFVVEVLRARELSRSKI